MLEIAPGEIEEILARLVAAGVEQPAALATLLGVEAEQIGRPLRALRRVGILAEEPGGGLRVSPRGAAWLQLPDTASREPEIQPLTLNLPPLEPLPPAFGPVLAAREPSAPSTDAGGAVLAKRRFAVSVSSLALPVPRVALRLPTRFAPRLVLDRRVAVVGAMTMVVALVGHLGVYSLGRMGQAPSLVAPAPVNAAVLPTPTAFSLAAAVQPTPTPTSTLAAERWMVVDHTNGLGLVLRPEPASTARVQLLKEGARLRVTGTSVEQSGHQWLPVTSVTGASGWVAGEFLAPEH